MKPEIWITRKFTYRPEKSLFPNLVARLAGTPARLEELLKSKPQELLAAKPNAGWSVLEHAGHLGDLEELWLRRFENFKEKKAVLTAWEVTNTKTEQAGHNDRSPDAVLATFRHGRQRMIALLDSIEDGVLNNVSLHPRLRIPMMVMDLLHFIAEHDDHHLAMIRWIGGLSE